MSRLDHATSSMGSNDNSSVTDGEGTRAPLMERPGHPGAASIDDSSKNDISFGRLLKHHSRDWLTLIIVAIVEICVYVLIPPFHRYVGKFNIHENMYPRENATVPTWSVLLIAFLIPLSVFLLYFIRRRSVRDFHNASLGLATTVALTALLTDSIKNCVGMARPDFFDRCFPDHNAVYDSITGGVICHGSTADIEDGYKSFPSGHASWSFAGLGYLALYLTAKLGVFDKKGRSSGVVIVFLPLLAATLVSVSRVNNYQHRWWDCIFGAFLGLMVAYCAYRTHFPSVYAVDAGVAYEYIPGDEAHSGGSTEPISESIREGDFSFKNGLSTQDAGSRGWI